MTSKYTLSTDGQTVTDSTTGLMWAVETLDAMTQEKAFDPTKPPTLAGYTDWRVPTVQEMFSIVDTSRSKPACDPVFQAKPGGYRTSTDYEPNPTYAWFVHFYYGNTYTYDKNYSFFVRLVRSGQ